MSGWRVIFTDTELQSGVAPVCPQPDVHAMNFSGTPDDSHVYDECCIGPHIECWSERNAGRVADELNKANAEECS